MHVIIRTQSGAPIRRDAMRSSRSVHVFRRPSFAQRQNCASACVMTRCCCISTDERRALLCLTFRSFVRVRKTTRGERASIRCWLRNISARPSRRSRIATASCRNPTTCRGVKGEAWGRGNSESNDDPKTQRSDAPSAWFVHDRAGACACHAAARVASPPVSSLRAGAVRSCLDGPTRPTDLRQRQHDAGRPSTTTQCARATERASNRARARARRDSHPTTAHTARAERRTHLVQRERGF